MFIVVSFIQKYEDTELDLKPLPSPKLVPTPDGIANELFGDVAMVTEFISCYQGLLMPEEEKFPVRTGRFSNCCVRDYSQDIQWLVLEMSNTN